MPNPTSPANTRVTEVWLFFFQCYFKKIWGQKFVGEWMEMKPQFAKTKKFTLKIRNRASFRQGMPCAWKPFWRWFSCLCQKKSDTQHEKWIGCANSTGQAPSTIFDFTPLPPPLVISNMKMKFSANVSRGDKTLGGDIMLEFGIPIWAKSRSPNTAGLPGAGSGNNQLGQGFAWKRNPRPNYDGNHIAIPLNIKNIAMMIKPAHDVAVSDRIKRLF